MSETDPFAVDLTEPLKWIAEMRELGVVLINATMGNPYAQPHYGRPFETPAPDSYESPEHPLLGVDRHFRATEVDHESRSPRPRHGRHRLQLPAGVHGPAPPRRTWRRTAWRIVGVGRGASLAAGLGAGISSSSASWTASASAARSATAPRSCGRKTTRWASTPPAAHRSTRKPTATFGSKCRRKSLESMSIMCLYYN